MITLQEFCKKMDVLLSAQNLSDYCPNGLQIEGCHLITKVATAVSANLETIQKAINENVNLLIVHHGIFWNKDSYVIKGIKKEKIQLLLKHEISLLAYHLPLDAHQELGNNWRAARDMGWSNLEPFGLIGVKGCVGNVYREEFKKQLENFYSHSAVCALGGKEIIKTAALISGGAHKYILDAAEVGVDAFITGNFDEPSWSLAHEEKINFFSLGHSATERIGPMALSDYISSAFGIPSHFIDSPNPF